MTAPYISIAAAKQAHLQSQIPPEWTLPASAIPPGMLTPAESLTHAALYGRVSVMDVPRTCGLLSSHELEITEKWSAKELLERIRGGEVTSEVVVRAFCKVHTYIHPSIHTVTGIFGRKTNQNSEPQSPNNSRAV